MHLFVTVVSSVLLPIVLFPIALANPLPTETYPEDSLLSSNSYGTGTDTTFDQRPSEVLPINLNTEGWNAANSEPVLLAKGSSGGGPRCNEGFGFACCDSSRSYPFYIEDKVSNLFQILSCGKGQSPVLILDSNDNIFNYCHRHKSNKFVQLSDNQLKDQPNCPYQLSDVRSCCREQENQGGLPNFVSIDFNPLNNLINRLTFS